MKTKKHIVIVGGGAGGLELAVSLGKQSDQFEVTLIDANRTHVWKPHLHEVAAGIMDSNKAQVEYLDLAKNFGFKFIRGRATGANKEQREVILAPESNEAGDVPERTIPYERLILAVGSTSNDFGTPGTNEHALRLDDLGSANDFHERLVNLAEFKERSASKDPISIAIVGGGATGVELAAELREASKKMAQYGHERMGGAPIKISVINAAPTLLPGMGERIAKGAQEILESRQIDIYNNAKVVEVQKGAVVFDSQGEKKTFNADLTLWAAGVKAPDFLKNFGLEQTRSGQLITDQSLNTSDPHITAMGDCAAVKWLGKEGFVPPRAQAAHQMASFLADNLSDIMDKKTGPGFQYKDFGSLVSLGTSNSVGTLMGALSEKSLFVEGKLAKFMYLCLYQGHQIKIHGPVAAFGLMIGKGLQKRFEPKVKLH